ncbi:MAG: ABC transporter ATP-binding protein [bacterium]
MAEFFETDDVTKGYDSTITSRILSYMKPHRGIAIAALLALIVSTAGELLSPVLIRRAIDDALMKTWFSVSAGVEGSVLKLSGSDPRIGDRIYLRSSRFSALSSKDKASLAASGAFDPREVYVFPLEPESGEQAALLSAHPELFTLGAGHGVISVEALRSLPSAEARALRRADSALVLHYVLVLGMILLAILASTFVMVYFSNLLGLRVMKDIRMQLFGHVLSRSFAFLNKQPVGRLVTRMTSDVETINQFFTDVLSAFIKDASIMAGALAVLYFFDLRLALVVTASLPIVLIVANVARKKARDAFRNQRRWTSKVNSYISEHISGVEVVKLFRREKKSKAEFAEHNEHLKRANLGEMYVFAAFRPAVDFMATLTTALSLCAGAWLYLSHSISLGTLIAFVNLISMFYSPIKDLSEKYILLQSAMAGGERIFTLLDTDETILDRPSLPMPGKIRGHIEFDRVWFAYKEEEWVLKDLSFTMDPGQMVAIVGYTGAGKTTIANLVTRFWDIQQGEIRIDGLPVKELPLQGLRTSIQPVPQEVFLFSGTIAENIRLGGDVSLERMKLAAEAVHANEFIEALSDKYDTQLSEGGSNISQGQRQLLSFARVLAHDPAIIILDEATSSVDTETEKLIQRGIEGLLAGRTSIVIAHRLSTIRHADKIIVLAKGRIAETGKHDELIKRRGLYWNLYRLQNSGLV